MLTQADIVDDDDDEDEAAVQPSLPLHLVPKNMRSVLATAAVETGNDPISVTRTALSVMAQEPGAIREQWAAELRLISLAAAAHGDFKASVDGMAHVGKSLGALSERTEQHNHLHIENLRDATDEQLAAKLDELKRQRTAAPEDVDNDPMFE